MSDAEEKVIKLLRLTTTDNAEHEPHEYAAVIKEKHIRTGTKLLAKIHLYKEQLDVDLGYMLSELNIHITDALSCLSDVPGFTYGFHDIKNDWIIV